MLSVTDAEPVATGSVPCVSANPVEMAKQRPVIVTASAMLIILYLVLHYRSLAISSDTYGL